MNVPSEDKVKTAIEYLNYIEGLVSGLTKSDFQLYRISVNKCRYIKETLEFIYPRPLSDIFNELIVEKEGDKECTT